MELKDYRAIWQTKYILRKIYADYYNRIIKNLKNGNVLEIGGGSGNFKGFFKNVCSTDIQFTPWLDIVADAQSIPVKDNKFDNIVMVDVLHHIASPILFFKEAQRILKPRGKIIAIEPAVTPISWFFYKFIHDESLILSANPFAIDNKKRAPFEANQAIPTLLIKRHKRAFEKRFPNLKLIISEYLSLFAYPLSGGFNRSKMLPDGWVDRVLSYENKILPILGKIMAFRLLIVLQNLK